MAQEHRERDMCGGRRLLGCSWYVSCQAFPWLWRFRFRRVWYTADPEGYGDGSFMVYTGFLTLMNTWTSPGVTSMRRRENSTGAPIRPMYWIHWYLRLLIITYRHFSQWWTGIRSVSAYNRMISCWQHLLIYGRYRLAIANQVILRISERLGQPVPFRVPVLRGQNPSGAAPFPSPILHDFNDAMPYSTVVFLADLRYSM